MQTITINGRSYKATKPAMKSLVAVSDANGTAEDKLDHLSRLVPVLLRSGELRAS